MRTNWTHKYVNKVIPDKRNKYKEEEIQHEMKTVHYKGIPHNKNNKHKMKTIQNVVESYQKQTPDAFRVLYHTNASITLGQLLNSLKDKEFHVIVLDAYHTHEQVYKDFLLALRSLKENGLVLIHDVCPDNLEYTQPQWCGDVFKTANAIIEAGYEFELEMKDHGLLIVKKQPIILTDEKFDITYDEWNKVLNDIQAAQLGESLTKQFDEFLTEELKEENKVGDESSMLKYVEEPKVKKTRKPRKKK